MIGIAASRSPPSGVPYPRLLVKLTGTIFAADSQVVLLQRQFQLFKAHPERLSCGIYVTALDRVRFFAMGVKPSPRRVVSSLVCRTFSGIR
jgi:hypothetical protein